jgi:hypothetical protein
VSAEPQGQRAARWASVIVGAWLAASAVATAQSVPTPTAAPGEDTYHRTIEDALQEFNLGNWDEAALLFERAHVINPSARTLRGMGMAAFEARHYVSAIAHLSAALSEHRNPLTAVQREEVQRSLRRAEEYVARVSVDVQPSAARVRINGQLVAADAQGERLVDPGLQELEIVADGYEPVVRRIHAAPGKRETLSIELRHLTVPAPATASPSDGPESGSLSTWKWLLGAGGLAGLAAGTTFLIIQKTEAAHFNDMCMPGMLTASCESVERRAGGTWYVGSIVGLGLGVGLSAASAVLFMLDSAEPEADHAERAGCQLGFADLGVVCKLAL